MSALCIPIPDHVAEVVAIHGTHFPSDEARMALAVDLARRNVEAGASPFGAAVFDGSRLVAAGVNCVLSSGFTIAHAEIVAMMRAQQELSGGGGVMPGGLTLVTSAEPCCQCFSALIWSGIDHLVCAATTADVERIGFDEGPKPQPWTKILAERAISVREGVLRSESVSVLQAYAHRGGPIYGLRPHPEGLSAESTVPISAPSTGSNWDHD